MKFKDAIRATGKYFTTAAMVVAFIVFEYEGIDYSDLFVAVLTACLGTSGILLYSDMKGRRTP